MKVEFGVRWRKVITGAHLYARILQISALLPLPYIFAIGGYPAIITSRNILSAAFDAGIMAVPRIWSLALSLIYRLTGNEIAVYFALAACALATGIIVEKLLASEEERAIKVRSVLAVLIAADLVVRILPFRFNLSFGLPMALIGWVCRAGCLALIVLDLRAAGKAGSRL